MKLIIIDKNDENQRLDKYLKKYFREAPGSFIYKMLRKKNITLNEKKADGSEKLSAADEIRMYLSEETMEKFHGGAKTVPTVYPEKELDILYEDDNLLLLNKPVGELSQKAEAKDASMNEYALAYLLRTKAVTSESMKVYRPSVCNRLDRNTSGILIVAKTYQAARTFGEALKSRSIRKYYRCIVTGQLEQGQKIEGYLTKDERTNMVTVSKLEKKDSSEIQTAYEPLAMSDDLTLLEVHLITGRTHQIRAHLASIGHPILGDPKYGNRRRNEKYAQKFQLLHAYRLELDGFTKDFEKYNGMTFVAPPPKAFHRFFPDMEQ